MRNCLRVAEMFAYIHEWCKMYFPNIKSPPRGKTKKLSLFTPDRLIKGVEVIVSLICNLDTRAKCVVSFTLRPALSRKKRPGTL